MTEPLDLRGTSSEDRMKHHWQYTRSFTPPVKLSLAHVHFSGCIKALPNVEVSILLKGFGGDYRSMSVIFRSKDTLDTSSCSTWLKETLIPLVETSPDEFEQKVLALIDRDCHPDDHVSRGKVQ